ncbi:MAG: trehalose-6-phosphate synthase [Chloroflexi bacterium RBG_16_50_9]|nr:MAG: trehalose-6-phosphate synthase [Chloroflexi bacterium RBG_16_50_9]
MVSNREPYIHTFSGRKIVTQVPASGLTTALDPVMRACGGTWIANGRGEADRAVVDKDNKVSVPSEKPRYSLKRVRISREEEDGYYYGFSNDALWPLCHIAYTRPVFVEADWNTYKKVNEIFARSVLDEVGDEKAFVFVQDYHLTLLSRLIKERNPNIITAQFWHIPWPNPEAFRICPWQEEILRGLLGNDLLGFHIRYHCNNFLDTVDRAIEAKVDRERYEVTCGGKKTAVRPFPISIDFEEISQEAQKKDVAREMERLKNSLGLEDGTVIGAGLDRMDYTKGIPDRLRAVVRFFEKYPEYRGRMVFIQAGVLSRMQLETYKKLNEEIDNLVAEINGKLGDGSWKPIIYLNEHLSPVTLMALRRLASFFAVSSLHDGMNLVAKEFVASRFDEDGVLLLSPFTGAARELTDALLVNPYATDHFADAIKNALEMPQAERQKRMRKMREVVRENNIYKWAADIISDLVKFEFGE